MINSIQIRILDIPAKTNQALGDLLGKVLLSIFLALAGVGSAMAIPGVDFSSYELEEAQAQIDKGDFDEAIIMLEEIVFFEPEDVDALNLLGFSLRNVDRNVEAMEMYNEALALDPGHQGALEYQGELFLKLGDQSSAEANMAKLLELCPEGCEDIDVLETAIEKFKDGIELSWVAPTNSD